MQTIEVTPPPAQYKKKIRCEIIRDSMQNYKKYAIPPAQLIIADVPYCYDEKTECWTTDGWKKFTDITYNDKVLSLNSVTQEMEYSEIKNIIIRDNTEKMIGFDNNNINLLVTENHRMYAMKKRKRQGIGIRNRKYTSTDNIRLAKNVNSGWYMPRSGYKWKSKSNITEIVIPSCKDYTNGNEHTKPEMHIPIEQWLPFFGLWLADGCVCNSKGKNGRQLYTISIKQAGDNRKIVSEMLNDFPFKYYEYKDKKTNKSNFNIHSKQLWLYLKQFGKSQEKFIPRWILDLPIKDLELFWKWYTFGDSHKNGDGITISSVSQRLIENLQEVALKLGVICQIRVQDYEYFKNPLYYFQFNKRSRNITYSSKKEVDGYTGKVWCLTLKTNSVFLVRRNDLICFCGNCSGTNFYGSNPMWYNGGDNKNGESKLAGRAAFNSDLNFNLYEYFHFCSKMMRKEDTKKHPRGRSSDSPCMIVFCSFEQQNILIDAAKKYGFVNYIPLVFIKNYSPQVLKANMRVVGATEYALILYRDKLPKFRNGAVTGEDGKTIRGTGHMVFNWFEWEKDGKEIPKIHPTQKPVKVLKKLIETFTDPGDVVIDPCFGSGTTLRAAYELGRSAYGLEIDKTFYCRARDEMLNFDCLKCEGNGV